MLQAPEEAVRLEQALGRLEQAMAAASGMRGDRIGSSALTAALEHEGDSPPGNAMSAEASAGLVEIAKPSGPDEAGSEPRRPPRDVARLEDVLTVASPRRQDVLVDKPASIPPPTVDLAQPPETPVVVPASPPEPASIAPPAPREASYVDAQALREAFWFEQASARQAGSESEANARQQPMAPAPNPAAAATAVWPGDATAAVEPQLARVWSEEPSRSGGVTTAVLLALLALVVFLAGRSSRRVGGRRAG